MRVSLGALIRQVGGEDHVRTVIDVGAHDGADSLPIARRYPRMQVIAIEPTPRQVSLLRQLSSDFANYVVVEAAIGETDGHATLNVCDEDGRLNSLLPFSEEGAALFERSETPDETVSVRTVRLDTLCDELGVEGVDVLHIDAQGSDLPVLRSLGRRLGTLRAGEVEAPYRKCVYRGAPTAR